MVQPLLKTSWWFLTKLNVSIPYDLAITFLRTETRPKELKTRPHKNLHTNVSSNLVCDGQNLEATKILSARSMEKETGPSRQWNIMQH